VERANDLDLHLGDRDQIAFGVGKLGNSDPFFGSIARRAADPPAHVGCSLQGCVKIVYFEAKSSAGFVAAASWMERNVGTSEGELLHCGELITTVTAKASV
jgi:hypothetical protein